MRHGDLRVLPHQVPDTDVPFGENDPVAEEPLFGFDEIGVRFSALYPEIVFTRGEIDDAFRNARLIRVISEHVASRFYFPRGDGYDLDDQPAEMEITGKPVRGVLSRRAVSHKGWVYSRLVDRILPWESRPELFGIQRLDCMTGVRGLAAQPLTLEYFCPITCRKRLAHPDIYLERNDIPLLLEIKRDFSRLKAEDIRRLVLLEKLFARAGVEYRGWDESGICEEPAFSNATWLARYNTVRLTDLDRLALIGAFATDAVLPLSELSARLEDKHQIRSFTMVLAGWILAQRDVSARDDPLVIINDRLGGN